MGFYGLELQLSELSVGASGRTNQSKSLEPLRTPCPSSAIQLLRTCTLNALLLHLSFDHQMSTHIDDKAVAAEKMDKPQAFPHQVAFFVSAVQPHAEMAAIIVI